ncbi:LysR family transcriptional regulator [Rhizobium leguminosarum]|uniref:HTH-type transcriptional regulator TtuA n=1 Tax=Rhizobium leguminosarum TaxID=384 RepID=A0AAJ1A6Q1_RHILE|nr:LysR family transcriptional regulator [Rhizobium leguminosarum]MBY5534361.1 LysR family transcriptional regulator [Rhizobium leguminosarum]MBY5595330.1 LysR family transcriptional regulator [Rhizobium leguminosarum]MBY5628191.1 LysR family transcriptional regulator [Rhizobium leguminosarum]MBY5643385.1 LysR family transcriptional regulator [Rhizobium leguminosarum]MBY5732729.1 LysR family transcriptional regulator [Rhizobium leguminosarum]
MDRFDAMSVLLAVVDAGSLSAGARQLRAPLATVSRKVADLEKHLGVPLVLRTRRGLSLTEEGRTFVAASRRILEELDAAERQASGDHGALRGGLHVTAPVAFGERHLLPIALQFLKEQPNINLRLTLVDRQINLADEQVDVALRIGHLTDSALITTRVGSVRRVICASPEYLARRGVPRQPEDLARHDGISFQGFATAPEWRYRRDGPAFAIEPHPKLAVNTTEAAIQAAMAGIGIIRVLSYQISDQLRSGALQELLTEFAPEPLPVNVMHGPADPLSLKVRCFLGWILPRLRARVAD